MITKWIARSKRWTTEERKAKEVSARMFRENARKIWLEKEKMRLEIEQEILQKVLAKRKGSE